MRTLDETLASLLFPVGPPPDQIRVAIAQREGLRVMPSALVRGVVVNRVGAFETWLTHLQGWLYVVVTDVAYRAVVLTHRLCLDGLDGPARYEIRTVGSTTFLALPGQERSFVAGLLTESPEAFASAWTQLLGDEAPEADAPRTAAPAW